MKRGILAQLLSDRDKFFDGIVSGNEISHTIVYLLLSSMLFFGIYGFVMGIYNSLLQALVSAAKVPILFILSLIICYPALFVFNVLLGSKLGIWQSLAMILSSYALTACILVSFAPITLFFLLIGSSYAFLRLMHVAIFAIAGIAGMVVLSSGLKYACEHHSVYPRQGIRVFQIWVIIFAFVGTQLAWNLRPFVGNKEMQFQFFRKQESNFYMHILHTIGETIGIGRKPGKNETLYRSAARPCGSFAPTKKGFDMFMKDTIADTIDDDN